MSAALQDLWTKGRAHGDPTPFIVPRAEPDADERPICFWKVESTGDWAVDCEAGVKLAKKFLGYAAQEQLQSFVIPWIVQDMIEAGKADGVVCGFMGVLASYTMFGYRESMKGVER